MIFKTTKADTGLKVLANQGFVLRLYQSFIKQEKNARKKLDQFLINPHF